MIIDPGRLDRRATILQPSQTANGIGDTIVTWASVGQRWSSFLQLLPAEIDREATPGSKAQLKLLLWRDELTSLIGVRWRVTVEGVTWNVVGTDPTPADGSLILYLAGVQA